MWHSTSAAFSTSTATTAALSAGTVALSDDDSSSALFAATGLGRSDSVTRCLQVTYAGSVAAEVRLYASSLTGTLGPYLQLTIEQGTGGAFSTCTGFSSSGTISTGTIDAFGTAHTNWTNALATGWSPTGAGQTRAYRITTTLAYTAPESASGTSAGIVLTWEARST